MFNRKNILTIIKNFSLIDLKRLSFIDLRIYLNIFELIQNQHIYQPIPFLEFSKLNKTVKRKDCGYRWQAIKKKIPKNINQYVFLDLGASEGYFSLQLAKLGAKVIAVEKSPQKITLLNLIKEKYQLNNLQIMTTNFGKSFLNKKNTKVDYVLYLNLHHHIYSQNKQTARKVLAHLKRLQPKAIFFEVQPLPSDSKFGSDKHPLGKVEKQVSIIQKGVGFSKAKEITPKRIKKPYRLFILRK